MQLIKKKIEYSTKYFNITSLTNNQNNYDDPYYVLNCSDCVSVIVFTQDEKILLVKQFRPTVNADTWELPSGHIDPGESAEEAARREVLEETGYKIDKLTFIQAYVAETGRLGFKSWCYVATNAIKIQDPIASEIKAVNSFSLDEILVKIKNGEINDALNIATILLAVHKGLCEIK